jgi:high affinity Mn2+ porin
MNLVRRAAFVLAPLLASPLRAQEVVSSSSTSASPRYTVHAQATVVEEADANFHAPYSGNLSLSPKHQSTNSVTATLFTGARLCDGLEAYWDPELSGGSGLSSANGLAGFPNGEIYRVGNTEPTISTARLFLQERIGFGGGTEKQEDDQNQLAETLDADRLTFVAGKFALLDYFDNNAYAHDPRTQFLNWVLMGAAGWDYPADTRGYTVGAMTEYRTPSWAVRGAFVAEPKTANGLALDRNIGRANGSVVEAEHALALIDGRKGTARALVYLNKADMGNYDEALSLANQNVTAPSVIATRSQGRTKYGFSFNADQELTDTLGVFTRDSWSDGRNESWAFVEIDESETGGLEWKPAAWGRPNDRLGAAEVFNELDRPHRRYLADGGYGFMIGDGALHYGPEMITEAYYRVALVEHLWVSPDFQLFVNPAYNRDRGPVEVYSLRVHAEF